MHPSETGAPESASRGAACLPGRCVVKTLGIGVLACVMWLVSAGAAAAQQPYEYKVTVQGGPVIGSPSDTYMTFSSPVGLPGVGLPAGSYVFRPLVPGVYQVLSRDRKVVYTTFFTVPASREASAPDFEAVFAKVNDTAPMRMIQWFEADQPAGRELLYPEITEPAETER